MAETFDQQLERLRRIAAQDLHGEADDITAPHASIPACGDIRALAELLRRWDEVDTFTRGAAEVLRRHVVSNCTHRLSVKPTPDGKPMCEVCGVTLTLVKIVKPDGTRGVEWVPDEYLQEFEASFSASVRGAI